MRIGIVLAYVVLLATQALACTCVMTPETEPPEKAATIVFRGTVTRVEKLPEHPRMRGRQRFAVEFRVEQYWRGKVGRSMTLHVLESGTDCMGNPFQLAKEYLVFAEEAVAIDRWLDTDFFWYGWTDVLKAGTPMVIPTMCTRTDEVSTPSARAALNGLGRGLIPRR